MLRGPVTLDHFALPKRPTSCLYTHHPLSLDYLSLLLAWKLKAHLTCYFFPGTHSRELLLLSSQPSVHGSSTGGRGEFSLLRVYSSAFPWRWHRWGLAFFSALAQGCPSSKGITYVMGTATFSIYKGSPFFSETRSCASPDCPNPGPLLVSTSLLGWWFLFAFPSPLSTLPHLLCAWTSFPPSYCIGFGQLHWQMFPLMGSQCLDYFLHWSHGSFQYSCSLGSESAPLLSLWVSLELSAQWCRTFPCWFLLHLPTSL